MNFSRPLSLVRSGAILVCRALLTRTTALLLGGFTASEWQALAQGGVPLWTNLYQVGSATGTAIAVDSNGNIFVTGSSDNGYATLGYSNAGVPLWTNLYNDGIFCSARAVAVDSKGSVFVTGVAGCDGVSNNSCDWATIKYSNAGLPLWTNRFNGVANARDWPTALVVDFSGNALVTGFAATSVNATNGLGYNFAYVTIKYSGAGQALWTNYYGPAVNWRPAGVITVDRNDNVFVAGASYDNGCPETLSQTIKYSSAGLPLWTNLVCAASRPKALAVDSHGDVLVLQGTCFDCYRVCWTITKFSGAGVPLWTNHCSGSAYDDAQTMAVDSSDNVFVTGSTTDAIDDYYTTIKFSEQGIPLWKNRYHGFDPGNADPSALVLDSSGNVIVTGSEERRDPNSSSYHFATVAYSSAGVPLWTNLFADQPDGFAFASGVAVDSSGNVFVTGSPYATIKYSSSLRPTAHLDFQTLNRQLVLNWTNSVFSLQSSPEIDGPFSSIIGATSPYTNPLSGPQRYFRLTKR